MGSLYNEAIGKIAQFFAAPLLTRHMLLPGEILPQIEINAILVWNDDQNTNLDSCLHIDRDPQLGDCTSF